MKLLIVTLMVCTILPAAVTGNKTTLGLEERIARLEKVNEGLIRQVALQAFYNQEELRAEGNSGIIGGRLSETGTKNFYSNSHIADSFMGMHDHSETKRTIGLGDLDVVMNGFYFRAKNNDYQLLMSSNKTEDYHATEKIPFPAVPPSVLKKTDIKKQIKEMQMYFEAFKQRDKTIRDYTPYFLPNLCFMEGAWTNARDDVKDSFGKGCRGRHARAWEDRLEKAKYEANSGFHDPSTDKGFLPKYMYGVDNGTHLFGQWTYRILCHPIKGGLDPTKLLPLDDLQHRVPRDLTPEEALENPGQRFVINERGFDFGSRGNALLDSIMNQIPGKNNYKGHVEDHTLGGTVLEVGREYAPKNTGLYHRYFKTDSKGAMGVNDAFRGYNDANNWVAQTTQKQVVSLKVEECVLLKPRIRRIYNCTKDYAAYTFAIPLEVVYTTPLSRWNPYFILEEEERQELPVPNLHVGEGTPEEVKAYYKDHREEWSGKFVGDVTEGGKRKGGGLPSTAYKAASAKHFYKTPKTFYSQDDPDVKTAGVLDRNGKVRKVASSGIRMFTHDIPDVGRVRLRYPLAPLHWEGSIVSKELNALREMTMQSRRLMFLYDEKPSHYNNESRPLSEVTHELRLKVTYKNPPGRHSHTLTISEIEYMRMKLFKMPLTVSTSVDQGHSHTLELRYNQNKGVYYTLCDFQQTCWDGHARKLYDLTSRSSRTG